MISFDELFFNYFFCNLGINNQNIKIIFIKIESFDYLYFLFVEIWVRYKKC